MTTWQLMTRKLAQAGDNPCQPLSPAVGEKPELAIQQSLSPAVTRGPRETLP